FLCHAPPSSPLFPYTTLFRSHRPGICTPGRPSGCCCFSVKTTTSNWRASCPCSRSAAPGGSARCTVTVIATASPPNPCCAGGGRSEEHTSELQSRENLVCRLL